MSQVGSLNNCASIHSWDILKWSQKENKSQHESPWFNFNGLTWCLRVLKGTPKNKDSVSCYLTLRKADEEALKKVENKLSCSIKIDNMNESNDKQPIERKINQFVFGKGVNDWGYSSFAKISDLDPLVSKDDKLCIKISITIVEPEVIKGDPIGSYEPYPDYIDSTEFSDVSFRVFEHEKFDVNDPDWTTKFECGQLFHTHKVVLASDSSWFKLKFLSIPTEPIDKEIYVFDVKSDIFKTLNQLLLHSQIQTFRNIRHGITNENVWEIWESAAKARYIKIAFDTEIRSHGLDEVFLYEAAVAWANSQRENGNDDDTSKKQLENDMAEILTSIRFTKVTSEHLAMHVETNDFVMSIDGMQKKLCEGYKYHAMEGTSVEPKHVPRNPLPE
ncbi:MAG: hypothetical protein EXX96DRAFT_653504 [Benjaminiella poitrasii]|nr:MAG: hypothetical protein EXX96DRAFT_653504 [Benjaminiella poitrasii]